MATVQKKGRAFFIFLFFIGFGGANLFPFVEARAIGATPAISVFDNILVNTVRSGRVRVSRVAGEEIRSFTVTKKGTGANLIDFPYSRVVFEGDEPVKDFQFKINTRSVSQGSYLAELVFTPDNFSIRSGITSTQAVIPTISAEIRITVTDQVVKKFEPTGAIIKVDQNAQAVFNSTIENKGNIKSDFDSVRIYTEDPKRESVVPIVIEPIDPGDKAPLSTSFVLPEAFQNSQSAHFDLLKSNQTVFSQGRVSLVFTAAQARPKKDNSWTYYSWLFAGVVVLGIIGVALEHKKKK